MIMSCIIYHISLLMAFVLTVTSFITRFLTFQFSSLYIIAFLERCIISSLSISLIKIIRYAYKNTNASIREQCAVDFDV